MTQMPFDLHDFRLHCWDKLYTLCQDDLDNSENQLNKTLQEITQLESFWAYPGKAVIERLWHYFHSSNYASLRLLTGNIRYALKNKDYLQQEFIPFYGNLDYLDKPHSNRLTSRFTRSEQDKKKKNYFEVLIIHPLPDEYEALYRNSLDAFKSPADPFIYDFIMVNNYQDAVIAILSNPLIQICVHLSDIQYASSNDNISQGFGDLFAEHKQSTTPHSALEFRLKQSIETLRPEIDHFYLTETPVTENYYNTFKRVLMGINLFADMHYHIISALEERYSTPFFDALRNYASKPVGAFHALPISQGQSINHSPWMRDVLNFYSDSIFAAETSSTLGGMDSLMDPKGSISQAQIKAARAFKAQQTYFVTNGTTTANKIVMQANLHPGDIILVSSECHKSVPYSIFLSGATAIFLESYPLNEYDLNGCVTLERIKEILLDLKQQNLLHRVKQITLTNSTFDGLIYDVKRYMMDILAIKPDIIFHWDEAWFSFGSFNPLYNNKTAMATASELDKLRDDDDYQQFYQQWQASAELDNPDYLLNKPLYPDPEQFRIRVYATHSIHKTLSAFRQASMLHIHDQDMDKDCFFDAYRTHTSTSPNYQLIASLDFARRQMQMEGYTLVKKIIQLAMYLRHKIHVEPLLSRYYQVLGHNELVPDTYYSNKPNNNTYQYCQLLEQFKHSVFNIDPTRVTLDISATGIDGPNFRQLLMTQYDIQVNKTSRNTILLIINIGATLDNITYLLESLTQIASKLTQEARPQNQNNKPVIVNLPKTRFFHDKFVLFNSLKKDNFQSVNIRDAYYAGLKDKNIDYITLSSDIMAQAINDTRWVSASFVTPYPPGFPIIVPGQIIHYDLLLYLQNIQIKEIHGYHAEKGLKVFNSSYLSKSS